MNPKQLKTAVLQVALVALSVVFVLPMLWMLSTALKPIQETLSSPPKWLPSHYIWANFPSAVLYGKDELGYIPFLVYTRNTVVVTILSVIGAVVSNSIVAYSFARLRWPGKDLFFAVTLATMMIPFPVLMVPTFALFKWLGWVGTFRPLWGPDFLRQRVFDLPAPPVFQNHPNGA